MEDSHVMGNQMIANGDIMGHMLQVWLWENLLEWQLKPQCTGMDSISSVLKVK